MISAFSGPLAVFGSRNPVGEAGSNNSNIGPSSIIGGINLLDPRVGYNVSRKGLIGIGAPGYFRCLSAAPATKATANLAVLANVASGVAMTLVSATGGGVTVVGAATTVWASGNSIPANTLALDGLPALFNYGAADPSGNYAVNAYSNGGALARALSITGVSGGAGGAFLVSGYDLYGYPMTETITAGAGAGTTNGLKAWKFVTAVTPQFTDAHNYSIGTADIFGFPLKATLFDETFIWWNSALITANTGFVTADTTSPATATTGDPRGTYAVQSASDGTKRLTVAVAIGQSTAVTPAGMFGVTPA